MIPYLHQKGKVMDSSVFITGFKIIEKKASILTKYQLQLFLCDKNFNEGNFISSLMDKDEVEKYNNNILKGIKCRNWTQAVYGTPIETFSVIKDDADSEKIVGLSTDKVLILRNEVRFL